MEFIRIIIQGFFFKYLCITLIPLFKGKKVPQASKAIGLIQFKLYQCA